MTSVTALSLLCLMLVVSLSLSPMLLATSGSRVFDKKSFGITGSLGIVVAALPLFGLGDPQIVWTFMLAQALLFCSFVCVSRMRQRKSVFLMTLTSIPSNGVWFVVMLVLASAYKSAQSTLSSLGLTWDFAILLLAAVSAVLVGRLVGAQWMQWVENSFQVRTDSVGSATLRRLDEKTPGVLWVVFLACFAGYAFMGFSSIRDLVVVMGLGFAQNAIYSVNTRFANRDHPGWPVVTALLGAAIFIVHWTYLVGYTEAGGFMPASLLIPYTVATVAGGTLGAQASMFLEKVFRLGADSHLGGGKSYKDITWHNHLLWATLIGCLLYILWGDRAIEFLGHAPRTVVLPFSLDGSWARVLALCLGGALFFIQNATHTLSSRAGNRNHAPYHAVTSILHGLMYFSVGTFVVLNARFLDLLPLAMLGSAAGQLFAMKLAMFMEKRLELVMDVPLQPKPAK